MEQPAEGQGVHNAPNPARGTERQRLCHSGGGRQDTLPLSAILNPNTASWHRKDPATGSEHWQGNPVWRRLSLVLLVPSVLWNVHPS